jgi:hypothetical protein
MAKGGGGGGRNGGGRQSGGGGGSGKANSAANTAVGSALSGHENGRGLPISQKDYPAFKDKLTDATSKAYSTAYTNAMNRNIDVAGNRQGTRAALAQQTKNNMGSQAGILYSGAYDRLGTSLGDQLIVNVTVARGKK